MMMKTHTFISLMIILSMSGSFALSQTGVYTLYNPIHAGFGVITGYNSYYTNGTLRCLGDPSCPTYQSGSGLKIGMMSSVEWMPNAWGMRAQFGFTSNTASMSVTDDQARVKNGQGAIVPLVRKHDLDASLSALNLDIGLQTSFGNTRLFFGPNFSMLLSPSWTSSSTLLSPSNVTFQSGKRDTTFIDEEIPAVNSLQFGLHLGIGHHVPLNTSMVLVPELSASIPFNAIRSASDWKQTSFMFGISLRWGTGAVKEEVLRRVELIDTVEVNVKKRIGTVFIEGKPSITKELEEFETHKVLTETTSRTDTIQIGLPPKQSPKPMIAVYPTNDVQQGNLKEIMVRGQLVTEAFPILPMVFFSELGSEIHPRYRQLRTIEGFNADDLEPLVSEQHKDILNIIGERLNRNPKATIQLQGYSDPVTEKSDCSLAEKRAMTIKEYLANVWNVDRSRMMIRTNRRLCMPENPTMSRNQMGYEENRRIEITSDTKEILSPVIRTRYVELMEYAPQEFHVNTQGTKGEELLSWNVSLQLSDSLLIAKDGSAIPEWFAIPISKEHARLMQKSTASATTVSMIVQDSEGEVGSVMTEIPIRRDTTNLAIQRLSLMHFPVQQATLDKQGKSAIIDFLKDLEDNASISIIGYSDNLGNAQSNMELSKERAETVHRYIQSIKPKANIIKVDGLGATALPPGIQSHELPESRFLSRTVQIEIIRTWKH